MKIRYDGEINGVMHHFVHELTPEELRQAWEEQQHLNFLGDVRLCLESINSYEEHIDEAAYMQNEPLMVGLEKRWDNRDMSDDMSALEMLVDEYAKLFELRRN